jgi:hypothetical protein
MYKIPLLTLQIVVFLFVLLSPGTILHIPPDKHGNFISFNSGNTSLKAIIVHSFVYGLLFYGFCIWRGINIDDNVDFKPLIDKIKNFF